MATPSSAFGNSWRLTSVSPATSSGNATPIDFSGVAAVASVAVAASATNSRTERMAGWLRFRTTTDSLLVAIFDGPIRSAAREDRAAGGDAIGGRAIGAVQHAPAAF